MSAAALAVEEALQGLLDVSHASLAGDESATLGAKNVFLNSLLILQLTAIKSAIELLKAGREGTGVEALVGQRKTLN